MARTPRAPLRSLALGLATAWGLAAGLAYAETPRARLVPREGVPQLDVRLLLQRDAPDRARVAVLFDLAPGWHVYWRSSGETGLPPRLDWQVPGGSPGGTRWPAPEVFGSGDDPRSYGYEGRVLLATPVRFASAPDPGTRITVDGDVLVCESQCVPARFRLARALDEPMPGLSGEAEAALFEEFGARVPRSSRDLGLALRARYSRTAVRPGDDFEAAIEVAGSGWEPAGGEAGFFPDDSDSIDLRVTGSTGNVVTLRGTADSEEPDVGKRLTGVLALRGAGGREGFVEVDLPFPAASAGAETEVLGTPWLETSRAAPAGGTGLLRALLLALLGGFVLNLMPCVLPVLAIKVFSISAMAEAARENRGEVLRHGFAYTGGIVGSMALLATAVLVLRAAGHSVGWGFQFQEPVYVAAICAVLVAFASNLFGAYEIRAGAGALGDLGQQATGARRSFFEGLLAVALATPCSAPFLGTAVGFAFASEPIVIVEIFAAVGLGLAAPFLLITWVPGWARYVPRSGPWMHSVRAGLGFALLATVLWLLWIFGGSAGIDGVVGLLGFLLTLAFALWCFGQLQRSSYQRTAFAAGLALIVMSAAGLNAVGTRAEEADGAPAPVETAGDWRAWSPAAVREALGAGSPVFVRFTADWCITCKVNERVALRDDTVRRALEEGGFALFVGDWTQRDEAIRRELARHGRAGVPLYLVYDPRDPEAPELLPEVLTADRVLASVRDLSHPQKPQPPRSARR